MQVLCDTSFIIILTNKPAISTVDLENEYGKLNLMVPDMVHMELIRLTKTANPKRSKMAANTIKICEKFERININNLSNSVDDSIIEYAKNHRCSVATIDKEMIKKLIKNNVLVITISQNKLIVGNYKI